MSTIEVGKGFVEVFGGKGYSVQSDSVTTHSANCRPGLCKWESYLKTLMIDSGYNWPFPSWIAYEVWVVVSFEYDGCDINNARVLPCSKTFSAWYNDKATFNITAKGGISRKQADSSCPECCEKAAVVEFDLSLISAFDFVRTDVKCWRLLLSANGKMQFTPT